VCLLYNKAFSLSNKTKGQNLIFFSFPRIKSINMVIQAL